MFPTMQVTRWLARILAALIVLLVVAFLIDEGLPNPAKLTPREQVMFVGLFLMLLGAVVGWKREEWGGALLLGGFVFFCVVDNLGDRAFRPGVWLAFGPFALVGLLFLLAAWAAAARR